jgi:hypothetical protein
MEENSKESHIYVGGYKNRHIRFDLKLPLDGGRPVEDLLIATASKQAIGYFKVAIIPTKDLSLPFHYTTN